MTEESVNLIAGTEAKETTPAANPATAVHQQLSTSNYQLSTKPFTLIELLVAVALGAIILGVAVNAFQQSSDISATMNATTEATHNARAAMRVLTRDLEDAYIEPTGHHFVGDNSQVDFTSWTVADTVLYRVPSDETKLYRYSDTGDGVAAFGVEEFNLRYYYDNQDSDPNDWRDKWDSTTGSGDEIEYRRMPQIVEVTIEVVDSKGLLEKDDLYDPVRIRRLIELPNASAND